MPLITHKAPTRRDANDICRYFWQDGIETAYDAKQATSAARRYRHVEVLQSDGRELVHVRTQDMLGLSPRLSQVLLASGNVFVIHADGRVREFADSSLNRSCTEDAPAAPREPTPRTGEHSGYYVDFHALEQAALKSADAGLAQYL